MVTPTQCKRYATYHLPSDLFPTEIRRREKSDLDELSSPSASPPPAQTMPSRTSRLKITLKLPTQKPARVRRIVHKDKDPDSAVESEDDDDQPRGGAKRPLTTRQAVLARDRKSVV